jgi:hypothetical protein
LIITMTQFAEQLDAQIAATPAAWKFTPGEKAALLDRAATFILSEFGVQARAGQDMVQ